METTVVHVPSRSRYELLSDDALVGSLVYEDAGNVRTLLHVEIERRLRGRGLAARLAERALSDTAELGLSVVPRCSYIAAYARRRGLPSA